jgi:hypothetical protein
VLAVGAADGRVAAIVSQCPFTDPQTDSYFVMRAVSQLCDGVF